MTVPRQTSTTKQFRTGVPSTATVVHELSDWIDPAAPGLDGAPRPSLYLDGHRGEVLDEAQLGEYIEHLSARREELKLIGG